MTGRMLGCACVLLAVAVHGGASAQPAAEAAAERRERAERVDRARVELETRERELQSALRSGERDEIDAAQDRLDRARRDWREKAERAR